MSREEAKKIVMIIYSAYPKWKPENLNLTTDTWAVMLAEYDYNQIAAALKAYITTDTSGYAPSIGQVIGLLDRIGHDGDLSEMEAWGLVSKALRNGNYGAETEFNKLPEPVRKTVGSPELLRAWALSDMGSIETVVQSNFMRTYKQIIEKQKEARKIPQDAVTAIKQQDKRLLSEQTDKRS